MSQKNYFDSIAQSYEAKSQSGFWGFLKSREQQCILKILKQVKFSNLLDLGSGPGTYIKLIKEEFPDKTYQAVDQSPQMIQKCKESQIPARQEKIEDLLMEQKFDLILALGIWEFLQDKERIAKQITSFSNQDSTLITLIPSSHPLNIFYVLFHKINGTAIQLGKKEVYINLLKDQGWNLVTTASPTIFSEILVFKRGSTT